MASFAPLNGLALSGGGARAAYQAGVLKAAAEMDRNARCSPFPIISAVSGGSMGATILAAGANDFHAAVDALTRFWTSCSCRNLYGGLPVSRLGVAWRILCGAAGDGWLDARSARALFAAQADFEGIAAAIEAGTLHALSLGAYGYASQQTVHFFQGRGDLEPWRDGPIVSAHVRLGAEHLAAAFAIPLVFPPVKVHREYFCDAAAAGRPEAAALRLGAGRILSIEADLPVSTAQRRNTRLQSGMLQAAAHAVASGFGCSGGDVQAPTAACETIRFVPSVPLPQLARSHWSCVPDTLRKSLERIEEETAFQIASLLLFEQPFLEALLDLGYRDGVARRDDLQKFLAQP